MKTNILKAVIHTHAEPVESIICDVCQNEITKPSKLNHCAICGKDICAKCKKETPYLKKMDDNWYEMDYTSIGFICEDCRKDFPQKTILDRIEQKSKKIDVLQQQIFEIIHDINNEYQELIKLGDKK